MSAHAKFSPSSSDRWMRCTASAYVHEQTESFSKYAHEGTVCHDAAANVLEGKFTLADIAGKSSKGVKFTPELIDAMQYYIDYVTFLKNDHMGGYIEKIEQKLRWDAERWGTGDFGLVGIDALDIADLKMGKGVIVKAFRSFQLLTYSSYAVKNFYRDIGEQPPAVIRAHIVQPRSRDGERDNMVTYTLDQVDEFQEYQNQRLTEIKSGKVKYTPGEKQCQWCSYKNKCKARAKWAIEQAQMQFDEFVETEKLPDIDIREELSEDELLKLFRNRTAVNKFFEDIEKETIRRQLSSTDFEDMKIIESMKHEKYVSDERLRVFYGSIGVSKDDTHELKLRTPSQMKKWASKNLDEEQYEELLNLIERPTGEPRLVHVSARGKEIPREDYQSHFNLENNDG